MARLFYLLVFLILTNAKAGPLMLGVADKPGPSPKVLWKIITSCRYTSTSPLVPIKGRKLNWRIYDQAQVILSGSSSTNNEGSFDADLSKYSGKIFEIEIKGQRKQLKIDQKILNFEVSC